MPCTGVRQKGIKHAILDLFCEKSEFGLWILTAFPELDIFILLLNELPDPNS